MFCILWQIPFWLSLNSGIQEGQTREAAPNAISKVYSHLGCHMTHTPQLMTQKAQQEGKGAGGLGQRPPPGRHELAALAEGSSMMIPHKRRILWPQVKRPRRSRIFPHPSTGLADQTGNLDTNLDSHGNYQCLLESKGRKLPPKYLTAPRVTSSGTTEFSNWSWSQSVLQNPEAAPASGTKSDFWSRDLSSISRCLFVDGGLANPRAGSAQTKKLKASPWVIELSPAWEISFMQSSFLATSKYSLRLHPSIMSHSCPAAR